MISDFDTIYNDHIDDLYRYACAFGLEKNTATDLIHDIFCRVLANPSSLRQVENVKYYLLRSLKNRITDMYRACSKAPEAVDIFDESLAFQINISIEDQLINSEEKKMLEGKIRIILAVLTNRQREIIYLRYIHGYDYEQISKLMNISVPACYKLLSVSMSRLRENAGDTLMVFIITNLSRIVSF